MSAPDSAPASIVTAVRRFVETEVLPVAATLEHADRYPHDLVARMRELGLFGALVPAGYGGLGLDVTTYARVIEELCRGWMSLAGVINSHTMAALIVLDHGTDEQRRRFLPRFARGEARGGLCLTEPQAGSDVQAIRTMARRQGDDYVITGTKMFITNGREGNTFALLALTDPGASPRHRGMSCFIVEKGHPGFRVVKSISKLGYKGVDTAELLFEDCPVPAANLVGGVEGRGFRHVMSGLETGRINIAARAVGVAQAALDCTLAHVRSAGGAPPPALADMAVRVGASRLLTYWAAGMKDRGERCDLEAGMAKLYASEAAQAVATAALRLHGEASQLLTLAVERHYRDAPLMIIGEGTNEIQRTLIARQLLERYGERSGALTSREREPVERQQIVQAVRQIVEKDIVPVAAEHDRAGRYPDAIVAGLKDLGLLGALGPVEGGGLGLDLATYAMIVEELARGSVTVAGVAIAHLTAVWALARFGADRRAALLAPLAGGEIMASVALGGAITARRDGDGWTLAGTSGLADNAPRADLYLVMATSDTGGRMAALVDRGTAGLTLGEEAPTLGGRGLDPRVLRLDGVHVPLDAVLEADGGREAAGAGAGHQARAAAAVVALARLGLAATALGLAQAAFEAALRYSQQRVAFGQPICQHQAIQLKLADMATAVTATRLFTYEAGQALDANDDTAPAMARLHAAQTACDVTLEAMRIHGGYGYTTEFPVERYYRDAPRLALALGGLDADRAELAARLAARE